MKKDNPDSLPLASITSVTPDGQVASLLLPFLPLASWRSIIKTCNEDHAAVAPVYKILVDQALDKNQCMEALIAAGSFQLAALRIQWLSGIDAEGTDMPSLVASVFAWAHYGKHLKSKLLRRRAEHMQQLSFEFPLGLVGSGINISMKRELAAVEAAVDVRLALNGAISEVAELKLVPADTPGMLDGRALSSCSRIRGSIAVTALMWSTRHGVRWVESLLRRKADPCQVTPGGWSALILAAAFESRGVSLDGASDSGEDFSGRYRHRTRGVVGPLLDAGADAKVQTLPLTEFLQLFGPSPLGSVVGGEENISAVDIAQAEAFSSAGWAQALLDVTPPLPS